VRSELLRILARLTLECSVGEEAGAWAVAALTADEDTDAIRVLAGFSANTPREEVTPWLRRVAHDLGVRLPTREESRWILVVFQAREGPRQLARIASTIMGLIVAFRAARILRSDCARTGRGLGLSYSGAGVFFFGCLYLQHLINEAADAPARAHPLRLE